MMPFFGVENERRLKTPGGLWRFAVLNLFLLLNRHHFFTSFHLFRIKMVVGGSLYARARAVDIIMAGAAIWIG